MRLQLIDHINEIESLSVVDTIDVGLPVRTKKLFTTRALNIIQLKLRWVKSSPDITSLTIIEGRYLYCPVNMRKWLRLWGPIVHADERSHYIDIDLTEYLSSRAAALMHHNVIILPEYYGDYSFHFGHFMVDIVPILKFLGSDRLSSKLSDIRFSIYPLLRFHEEIIAREELSHLISLETNKKILDAIVYADRRRVIWAERSYAHIVLPDLNYGFAKAISCRSSWMQEHTATDAIQLSSLRKHKRVFRGLVFNRSGSSDFVRATNCSELESKEFSVNTRFGRVELSFESFDYLGAGVVGRVDIAKTYDFVVGPYGSHFIPTMLSLEVLHMFIVPFIPPASLIEERLEGFCYYPRELYRWIPADPSWQHDRGVDMQSFHYSEYSMDINSVVAQIASAVSEYYTTRR